MIWGILRGCVLLSCALLFAFSSAVVLAEEGHPESAMQGEVLRLQARLGENLKQEALIQERMRTAFGVVTRPHSAYLLHQKSLGLQDNRVRLQRLRGEREKIIQEIRGLRDKGVVSQALLRRARGPFLIENAQRYSGSPTLSFQEARWVYAEASSEKPIKTGLFRMMMAGFLLFVFSLPLVLIFRKGAPVRARKRLVRVFPLFTVYGADGWCGMLKIHVDAQGRMRSHLNAS